VAGSFRTNNFNYSVFSQTALAFRGSANRLYGSCNGNFMKMVEMIVKSDPVVAEYVSRIQKNSDNLPQYLGEK
jgi:hypothetical protein